jgi:membrane-bound inhibitor of C-type lysozyme
MAALTSTVLTSTGLKGEAMKCIKLSSTVLPLVILATALPVKAQDFVKYQCNEGKSFEVQYLPNRAWVKMDNLKIELYPVAAAEGLKYSNGRTLLQANGNKATINVNFQPYFSECLSQKDMTPFPNLNPFAP